jgi:hypothetical protein
MLQDVLKTIRETGAGAGAWEKVVAKFPEFASKFATVNGESFIEVANLPLTSVVTDGKAATPKAGNKFVYVSLKGFCKLVNTLIVVDSNKKNLIRLNTTIAPLGGVSTTTPYCRFRTYKFHTSSDPGACILTTPGSKNWPYQEELLALINGARIGSSDEILNIYVNINVLEGAIEGLLLKEKGERTLLNLFEPIFLELNDVLGGINDIGFQYEEDEFTYYIVDRKAQVENADVKVLNITGLKSTVTQFDFVTKLSPAITTMCAISAQAGAADVGLEAGALLRWNEGLEDRIIGKKTVKADDADDAEKVKQQSDRREVVQKALSEIYNSKIYTQEAVTAARTNYSQFSTNYVQYYAEDGENSVNAGPAGIIPFEVRIEMDGISGIKLGQAFRINKGIMPEKYDGVVGFIVTGLDHSIAGNRWTTNLKAQTIVLKGTVAKGTGPTYSNDFKKDGTSTTEKKGLKPKGSGKTCTEPYTTKNLSKGWEGKQVPFKRTIVDPAVEGPKLVATYGKTLAQAMLTTMQIEQGYRGFNWNLGGFDITSGGWTFNAKLHDGYVVAKEGGTGLCKAFVSFINFETFIEQKVASFKRKGFEKGNTAESFAKIWYEKWNGFGARTVNPNNLTDAQLDANAKSFAAGLWKKNAKYV